MGRWPFWPGGVRFQSHAGSIEARIRRSLAGPHFGFQSHAGSIEAGGFLRSRQETRMFQSHAGSIEADTDMVGLLLKGFVSIPRWFD
mgnify:CR=1 FL=1